MTRFQLHVNEWKDCTRCVLHEKRRRVVFARGKIPCDVLFVGTAPGISEDLVGQPFVGPAGKLMNYIVARAFELSDTQFSTLFYNLVGCVPKDEVTGRDTDPPVEAIKACGPRLVEFSAIANARLVVCVGSLSRHWLDPRNKGHIEITRVRQGHHVRRVLMPHPGGILKSPTAARDLLIQNSIIILADAFRVLAGKEEPSAPQKSQGHRYENYEGTEEIPF